MERNALPRDLDELFAVAEETANLLAENRIELGLPRSVETELRASLAAAVYARRAYAAMEDGARRSAVARRFLPEAARKCARTKRSLFRRLQFALEQMDILMNEFV
jgi:hypothetical protein